MDFLLSLPAETNIGLLTDVYATALAFKHLSITLAPDAIDTLQHHGLWTFNTAAPSTAPSLCLVTTKMRTS